MAPLQISSWFTYDGGPATFTYREAGVHYQEKAYAIIENMGKWQPGCGATRRRST